MDIYGRLRKSAIINVRINNNCFSYCGCIEVGGSLCLIHIPVQGFDCFEHSPDIYPICLVL